MQGLSLKHFIALRRPEGTECLRMRNLLWLALNDWLSI